MMKLTVGGAFKCKLGEVSVYEGVWAHLVPNGRSPVSFSSA